MKKEIMISAVWTNGTTVDNDKINITGKSEAEVEAIIQEETERTKAWWSDAEEPDIMITVYEDGHPVQ